MGNGRRSYRDVWKGNNLIVILLFVILFSTLTGCGEKTSAPEARRNKVERTAATFLDACGNLDTAQVIAMLSARYREECGLNEVLTKEELSRALGNFSGYRFEPDKDIILEDCHALVTVTIDYGTYGQREETLVLVEENGYKVENFTALRWESPPINQEDDDVADTALRELKAFLDACLRKDTKYIYEHLSTSYKEEHRLSRPWSAAEFAGIFGEARSYQIAEESVGVTGGLRAEVEVTIYFGSRGNLESETSRVELVVETATWRIGKFPFFIY